MCWRHLLLQIFFLSRQLILLLGCNVRHEPTLISKSLLHTLKVTFSHWVPYAGTYSAVFWPRPICLPQRSKLLLLNLFYLWLNGGEVQPQGVDVKDFTWSVLVIWPKRRKERRGYFCFSSCRLVASVINNIPWDFCYDVFCPSIKQIVGFFMQFICISGPMYLLIMNRL